MRVFFCILAALVAGFGLAVVLGLGTAAVSAAIYKSQGSINEPVSKQVQAQSPLVAGMAAGGFIVGAGVVVWMFASYRKAPNDEPAEL